MVNMNIALTATFYHNQNIVNARALLGFTRDIGRLS